MIALLLVTQLAMEIAMAKPPEPLEEIFPQTSLIVDATVLEVKSTDARDPSSHDSPRQVLVLKINSVVRGALSVEEKSAMQIVVVKPRSGYTMKAGVTGPWLLALDAKTGERTVLGRYGPDSWRMDKVELKLKELDPANLREAPAH